MAGDELTERSKRGWILGTIKAVIGIGLLVYLIRSDRLQLDVLADVRHRWGAVVIAQLFFLSQFFLSLYRWQILLRAFGIVARFGDVVRLGWIGLLFNQIIPGATGGDVVKGVYVARETPGKRTEAVLTIIIDRVVGLTGLMPIGVVIVLLHFERIQASDVLRGFAWLLPGILVAVFGGAWLLTWQPFWRFPPVRAIASRLPMRPLLTRIGEALYQLRQRPLLVAGILLMSICGHFIGIGMHYYLACALVGEVPDIGLFLFADPMGQLVNAVPVTPGGVGVGEGAYDVLFQAIDSPVPGASLMILIRASWLLWGAVGVYFYLKGRGDFAKVAEMAAETEDELLHARRTGEGASAGRTPEGVGS